MMPYVTLIVELLKAIAELEANGAELTQEHRNAVHAASVAVNAASHAEDKTTPPSP